MELFRLLTTAGLLACSLFIEGRAAAQCPAHPGEVTPAETSVTGLPPPLPTAPKASSPGGVATRPENAGRPDGREAKGGLEQSALREARGTIKGVDKDRNQVTLSQPEQEALTLQVEKTTTIFIDGRTGSLADIKAGSEVRASYEVRKGNARAQWIEVSKKDVKPGQSRETLPDSPGAPTSPEAPAPAPPPVPR